MPDPDELMKRQQVLADFGEFAIGSDDLDEVLMEACRLVGEALGTERAKVLEIQEGGEELFVRAGVGWAEDVVGKVRLPMDERSSETYSIRLGEPVVSTDISREDRFEAPDFMESAGVVALVNVPIFVPGERPYGILQVDDTEPREFGDDEIQFLRTYAMILGPVIDRLRLVEERKRSRKLTEESESRQAFLLQLSDALRPLEDPFEIMRASTRLLGGALDANRAFYATIDAAGDTAHVGSVFVDGVEEGAGSYSLSDFPPHLVPEWRAGRVTVTRDVRADEQFSSAQRRAYATVSTRAAVGAPLLKGGRLVAILGVNLARPRDWSEAEVSLVRETAERTWSAVERARAETALRESEERLRSAVEVGRLGLWDWNVQTGELHWSDEHFRLEGYEVGEITPSYEAWASRIHPDDRQATEAELHRAMGQGGHFEHEFRTVHPDGSVHWLHGVGRFFCDEAGRAVRMIGAMTETTAQREWAERQAVLVAELQHRTRNLIGVVRSVSERTAQNSADLADFQTRFRDRLGALARVQGLLSRLNDGERVNLDDLVRTELDAMEADRARLTVRGPEGVKLRSATVQTLAMALHELATNAVKYGALGQESGHLTVTWSLEDWPSDGRRWLTIEWRERGVSMATDAGAEHGSGQGRELIEKALPYQLGAVTSYELGPDGVHCEIAIPLPASTSDKSAGKSPSPITG